MDNETQNAISDIIIAIKKNTEAINRIYEKLNEIYSYVEDIRNAVG